MKKLTLLCLPFLFFCLSCFAKPDQASEEVIKKTITALMKENNIPGVAVEIYADGVPSSYYFGYADRDRKKPVTKQTIFEIGSISKVLTSLLFAQAVDFEKVQFKTPVAKYLAAENSLFSHISLQDLATHTAGLPLTPSYPIKTRDDLDKYLSNWSQGQANARANWTYSNIGIALLGLAIQEESQEKDINNLYITQILKPLGMKPIALTVPKNLMRYYAQGYDVKGQAVEHVHMDLLAPAYGIKMSANDMQRFLGAAVGLETTPWSITFPMRLTQSTYVKLAGENQGLAWQIYPLSAKTMPALLHGRASESLLSTKVVQEKLPNPIYNGNYLIDKTGMTNGFRAYIAVIPNKKIGIAILTNKGVPDDSVPNAARSILFKLAKL